jgi:hypothetical protein
MLWTEKLSPQEERWTRQAQQAAVQPAQQGQQANQQGVIQKVWQFVGAIPNFFKSLQEVANAGARQLASDLLDRLSKVNLSNIWALVRDPAQLIGLVEVLRFQLPQLIMWVQQNAERIGVEINAENLLNVFDAVQVAVEHLEPILKTVAASEWDGMVKQAMEQYHVRATFGSVTVSVPLRLAGWQST